LSQRNMRKTRAEPYRDIDFSKGKRSAVIAPAPGKTKISIRLDNAVLDHFRAIVEAAGGGNYQSLINDALVAHIHRQAVAAELRKVVREEYDQAMRRFLARAPLMLNRQGKGYPKREELYDRGRLGEGPHGRSRPRSRSR